MAILAWLQYLLCSVGNGSNTSQSQGVIKSLFWTQTRLSFHLSCDGLILHIFKGCTLLQV